MQINFQNIFKMFLALLIGIIGSIFFIFLNLPLPWLLGSIFAVSIAIRFDNLKINSPKPFSTPARILIGLTIGSAFTPEILDFIDVYLFSLLLVIPYTLLTIIAGMYYYTKYVGFDKKTAYLSSMPGGVVEMVIIGEEIKANISKITLVQSSRLFFIVITLPFVIQYIFKVDIQIIFPKTNMVGLPFRKFRTFSNILILIYAKNNIFQDVPIYFLIFSEVFC